MSSTAATMPMGWFAGLLVFSLASVLGGLATGQAWLIAARAVQGAGAAMAASTALALVAVMFPEGWPRNRAVAVYSAMAIVGVVVGLMRVSRADPSGADPAPEPAGDASSPNLT